MYEKRSELSKQTGLRRSTLPTLFVLAALLIPLMAGACGELSDYDSRQVESAMRDTLLTTNEIWDLNMMIMDNGKRRAVMQGDYAIDYNELNRRETVVRGDVYIQIYDSTNTRVSEARSDRAIYRIRSGEFELFDSVSVSTRDSTHLYTDYLQWSQKTDRISTDRFVVIITPNDSLTGTAFNSSMDMSDWVLTSSGGRAIVE